MFLEQIKVEEKAICHEFEWLGNDSISLLERQETAARASIDPRILAVSLSLSVFCLRKLMKTTAVRWDVIEREILC